MMTVITYSWRSGDLLHTADTYCDGLKTVGDLRSFFVGLWILQFGACACSSVVYWCICPVHVLLFYILNNKEFWDNFFLSVLAGCSRSKGVHPAASAVVYCVLPGYYLWIWVHAVDLHLKWKAE